MSDVNGRDPTQATEARLSLLEHQQRKAHDRDDELLGAVRELGERMRGAHGVATDAAAGVSSLHVALRELRRLVETQGHVLELIVERKRKTAVRPKLARRARRQK